MRWVENLLPGLSSASSVHPMFVHFPIALWTTALLFQVLGCFTARGRALEMARWLLYLGTLSAVVAVITGYREADRLGHDSPGHEFVHVHRNYMLATTLVAVVLCVAAFAFHRKAVKRGPLALAVGMIVLGVLLTLGADRGAALVFRYGMGVSAEAVGQEAPEHPPHSHEH